MTKEQLQEIKRATAEMPKPSVDWFAEGFAIAMVIVFCVGLVVLGLAVFGGEIHV
jgi:hypothetical protein